MSQQTIPTIPTSPTTSTTPNDLQQSNQGHQLLQTEEKHHRTYYDYDVDAIEDPELIQQILYGEGLDDDEDEDEDESSSLSLNINSTNTTSSLLSTTSTKTTTTTTNTTLTTTPISTTENHHDTIQQLNLNSPTDIPSQHTNLPKDDTISNHDKMHNNGLHHSQTNHQLPSKLHLDQEKLLSLALNNTNNNIDNQTTNNLHNMTDQQQSFNHQPHHNDQLEQLQHLQQFQEQLAQQQRQQIQDSQLAGSFHQYQQLQQQLHHHQQQQQQQQQQEQFLTLNSGIVNTICYFTNHGSNMDLNNDELEIVHSANAQYLLQLLQHKTRSQITKKHDGNNNNDQPEIQSNNKGNHNANQIGELNFPGLL